MISSCDCHKHMRRLRDTNAIFVVAALADAAAAISADAVVRLATRLLLFAALPLADAAAVHNAAHDKLWGFSWRNMSSSILRTDLFQQTYWRSLDLALGSRFAHHPLRTDDEAEASYCVVNVPNCASRKFFESLCPGKLIVKIDKVDGTRFARADRQRQRAAATKSIPTVYPRALALDSRARRS